MLLPDIDVIAIETGAYLITLVLRHPAYTSCGGLVVTYAIDA